MIEFSLPGDGSREQGEQTIGCIVITLLLTILTTGNDDQQLPVTGEEGVSEASDVDESANAEGQ